VFRVTRIFSIHSVDIVLNTLKHIIQSMNNAIGSFSNHVQGVFWNNSVFSALMGYSDDKD